MNYIDLIKSKNRSKIHAIVWVGILIMCFGTSPLFAQISDSGQKKNEVTDLYTCAEYAPSQNMHTCYHASFLVPYSLLKRGSEGHEYTLSFINGIGAEINTMVVPRIQKAPMNMTPVGVSASLSVMRNAHQTLTLKEIKAPELELMLSHSRIESIFPLIRYAQTIFSTAISVSALGVDELHPPSLIKKDTSSITASLPRVKTSQNTPYSYKEINPYSQAEGNKEIVGEDSITRTEGVFDGNGYIQK